MLITTFRILLKRCNLLLCLIATSMLMSCVSSPQLVTTAEEPVVDYQTNKPTHSLNLAYASFYSSYVSKQTSAACEHDNVTCEHDTISPQVWYQAMSEALQPTKLVAAKAHGDYEILVATQRQQDTRTNSAQTIVEVTTQWRGIPIDIYKTNIDSDAEHGQIARSTVDDWVGYAANKQIFTTPFLYHSIHASNYFVDLSLPESLGAFQLQTMRLHKNPFQGARARYIHPTYQDEWFDITVSPVMRTYENNAAISNVPYLNKTITKELKNAQKVAEKNDLLLSVDTPITDYAAGDTQGFFFSIHATDNIQEPLYAATYVFQKKDKLVKFKSTFPAHIASPLVKAAMQELAVPDESGLMKQIRQHYQ